MAQIEPFAPSASRGRFPLRAVFASCVSRRDTRLVAACLLLASMVVAGCKSDARSPTTPSGSTTTTSNIPAVFTNLAGRWRGTWTDTRYNVTGTLDLTITVNGTSLTATGTIGLQSLGLGIETGTASGTATTQNLPFSFTASTVGSGTGTILATGAGSGSGSVTGVLNLGAFTYDGTVTASQISGNFTFSSPTGGRGTANLAKQ